MTTKTPFHILIILFCFLTTIAQESFTIETLPNPKATGGGWVSDPNSLLTSKEKEILNQSIDEIEENTTVQIAIVLVQSIGQAIPKDFATGLFQKWKIGQGEKDNGLLILTVVDQRRTEMETGYGLEGILPDASCYRIESQELVPFFKKGEYGKGLIQGIRKIKQIVEEPETIDEVYADNGITYQQPDNGGWHYISFTYYLLLVLFLFHFVISVAHIDRDKGDYYDKYIQLKKKKHILYSILFPFPFVFIYLFFTKPRLSKYRKAKRYSKQTGKEFFTMDEKIDDVFLEEGQIIEEEIGSIDYDVWVTQELDDILILKYDQRSKYSKCEKCNYKTFYKKHSAITKAPTTSETGIRTITYACKNCGFQKKKKKTISRKSAPSSSFGGSSHFSSSSSGGSSFGGSSFGGGSSGGGGSGISW